ncbi:NAD(P)-binding protein [Poronia punctata]|nr:NAD(P)-binding protein [Poronia punctata]
MTSATGSILVTGANGGLGSSIARQISSSAKYAKTYHGIYTVRDVGRATEAKRAVQKADSTGHTYDLVALDLSSLASTRRVAEEINRKVAEGEIPPIRALILNAATQEYTGHTMTGDGFDMTFQTNYLSHFLLTLLLLKSMDKENGRVVVLGSWSHDTADKRNLIPGVMRPYAEEKYNLIFKEPISAEPLARGKWSVPTEEDKSGDNGYRRYGASKLCEIMFMRELSKRIKSDPTLSSLSILSVDPGAMPTYLTRERTPNALARNVMKSVASVVISVVGHFRPGADFRTTEQSGSDVLYAAFELDGDEGRPNGVYLNGRLPSEVSVEARDERKCEVLWRESLGFVELKEGDTVLEGWR